VLLVISRQGHALQRSSRDAVPMVSQPTKMFPIDLLDSKSQVSVYLAKPLAVLDKTEYSSGVSWFKPSTIVELLTLLKDFGDKEGGCKIDCCGQYGSWDRNQSPCSRSRSFNLLLYK
jgi:hypothetical protein